METNSAAKEPKIAITIPCYQEEKTIGRVVSEFRQLLPQAEIIVFDNNCTDRTAEVAREAGASVVREHKQGKGHVVASIFENVDADIIVMIDGDGTYDTSAVHDLLQPILAGDADMTVAARMTNYAGGAFRKFHLFGNQMVCVIINRIFESSISDIFSGYRAFTRECAQAIPITSRGFDVETELTVQTLYRGLVIKEISAPYGERPTGSFSKLNTIPDGIKVLLRLFLLLRAYKPLTLFGGLALVLSTIALVAGFVPLFEILGEGQITNGGPAALFSCFTLLLSFGCLALGLVLSSVNQRLLELERVAIKRMKAVNQNKTR